MLTLSVKTSRDHPLPPPSPLRSLVSSFLLSCQIKFDRHDLVGQVKPDGTLVGSCILNWNRGGCRSYEMIICVLYMRIEMHILSLGWEENECIVYYRKSLTNFIT